jgi:hypothetical protein
VCVCDHVSSSRLLPTAAAANPWLSQPRTSSSQHCPLHNGELNLDQQEQATPRAQPDSDPQRVHAQSSPTQKRHHSPIPVLSGRRSSRPLLPFAMSQAALWSQHAGPLTAKSHGSRKVVLSQSHTAAMSSAVNQVLQWASGFSCPDYPDRRSVGWSAVVELHLLMDTSEGRIPGLSTFCPAAGPVKYAASWVVSDSGSCCN